MSESLIAGQETKVHMKKRRREDRRIAYFSMEIGIDSQIPTYSGGLGVLAGDTIRSCADLQVPLVAVTLLYKKGYFLQKLGESGEQQELPQEWDYKNMLQLLPEKVTVTIEGREVSVKAWMYEVNGPTGYFVPIIFLDTDLESNHENDRRLSYYLYGEDERYRLSQEVVLGIGGVRMLKALGFDHIAHFHMNEGHASLLTLELLNERREDPERRYDYDGVKSSCVFTTHTPVPAGHDQFSYDLVNQVMGDFVPLQVLKRLGGDDKLNMTLLALNLSDYINGVAKAHGKVSQEMFPGYRIESITNGVHSSTWVCDSFKSLFDSYIPGWRNDPFSLRYALSIPGDEVLGAHLAAKKKFIDFINKTRGSSLDYDALTIGFARRSTAYKRADLIFFDQNRLMDIASRCGKIQFVFSGKAHPKDWPGKELIKRIFAASKQVNHNIKVEYIENYNMEIARMFVSGVDVWLNTPRRPQEASGTSGMKAAHNGVPSLSILDGWWIEGCIEGITGWSIGTGLEKENADEKDAFSLYEKLEKIIMPAFYHNRQEWVDIMRNSIAINASFFNTHRMVQQYVLNAYLF